MSVIGSLKIAQINIGLEAFGTVLSLLIILFLRFNLPKKKSRQDTIFIAVLLCNAIVLANDAVAWIFKGEPGEISGVIVHIANFSVFAFGYVLMALASYYLYSFLTTKGSVSSFPLYVVAVTTAVALLLLLLAEHFDWYYCIDENNVYHRQSLFWISQAFGIAGMLANAGMLVRYRKTLSRRELTVFSVYTAMPLVAMLLQIFFYGLALLYISTCAVCICTYMLIQSEQYIKQELELEKSRNANMLSQIQPHFVFNTLNSISALCLTNPHKADNAIVHFSEYLRENIEWLDNDSPIDFSRELKHLENYIAIETMRFGDRLHMVYEIGFQDFRLPPLTVQPLVENAVKHGVMQKPQGGTVVLRTQKLGETAVVTIVDDGVGFDPNTTREGRIGLKNVRFRLAFVGGTLRLASRVNEGTTVEIVIPLKGEIRP